MKKITKELIDKYANNLLFALTPEENEMIQKDFDDVIRSCNTIIHIPNLDKTLPMTHCLDNFKVQLREDKSQPSVTIDKLLKNTEVATEREVEIPKVVE